MTSTTNIGIQTAIAAHRGWHVDGAAENSIAALERASEGGVDWVEMDVRRFGDGTMVNFHDPRLDGLPMHRLDRSVLERHPDVPTLDAWVKRAGELDMGVIAEVKETGYEDEVVSLLRRHVRDERLRLMSFETDVVRNLARVAPDLPVGVLEYDLPITRRLRDRLLPGSIARDAVEMGATFVALNKAQTTPRVLDATARAGLDIAAWTIDDPARIARLVADGRVTTIITDAPARALAIRDALAGVDALSGVNILRRAVTALR